MYTSLENKSEKTENELIMQTLHTFAIIRPVLQLLPVLIT